MADIEEIRKKIDHLINEKGYNYRDISLKIGRKDSYIQQYVKYGYPRRLKEIDRMRLAKLLNVDDSEIMDDEIIASKTLGSPHNNLQIISDIIKASNTPDGNLVPIDVLSPHIDSQNTDHFLDNVIGKYLISQNALEDLTSTSFEHIKIVKVTGDSMKPTINAGDSVWVDTSYNYPEIDGLYLLGAGRELMIKRIQISPLDGSIEISGDNAAYKTYIAPSYKEVKVLGKLICHLKRV